MYGFFFCHVSAIHEETFGFSFWDTTKIFSTFYIDFVWMKLVLIKK